MTKRKVRLRLGYLAWTLFLATTLAPSVSYSVSVDPTTAKILRDIEECKALASVKVQLPGEWKHDSKAGGVWVPPRVGIPDRNRNRIGLVMSSIYAEYNRKISLPSYERVCIMTSVDPAALESLYREWEVGKKLQVLHELIIFTKVLATNDIRVSEGPNFVNHVKGIRESCKTLEEDAKDDIKLLRVAYWKLRFIGPALGVKEILASVETKIEIALVKDALRERIDKGEPSVELEQRIAKLPADAIKDIEDLRGKLLDKKAKQLAMAKEEEAKREKALRRQQVIDQAIKLRKEEIDTGNTNPTLQEQLSKDSELKSAVGLWESQYRKELADKKAREAKKKLEEIELAKAEEARRKEEAKGKELAASEERRRKIEAEIAEKERVEKENKIQAKLKRYNVKATVTGYDLHSNPFTYEGQSVVIRLRFDRMTERTTGVFTSRGYEILVSRLPTDLFTSAGQVADLIVKVKGTVERILLATPIKIPHVEYIDILQ